MIVVEARKLSKTFTGPAGPVPVLRDMSFSVRHGQVLGVFGPNGCGKSTLVNVLSGLEQADRDSMLRLSTPRNKISFVFQDYRRSLLPWRGVLDNIAFPLILDGVRKAEARDRAASLMDSFGVHVELSRRVSELSGGQAQTLGILRALVRRPALLILDEPFSALDFEATLRLRGHLLAYIEEHRLTTIVISHDLEEALYMADQTLLLSRRPANIAQVIDTPLERPRHLEQQREQAFLDTKRDALEAFLGLTRLKL